MTVGENSVVAAQAGIAGSTRIGKNVTLAGQVGVVNHIEIGDGATIGPASRRCANRCAPARCFRAASPRRRIGVAQSDDAVAAVAELWSSVRNLEKQMARLLEGGGQGE